MADTQLGVGHHAGWKGSCGLHGLLCSEDERDATSIVDASRNIFFGLVLSYAAGVLASRVARSRKRMKLYWSAALCFMLCGIQTYYLYQAANKVTPTALDAKIYRYDCHDSRKGGKIAKNERLEDRNPCFCELGTCMSNGIEVPASDCPLDGTCTDAEGNSIPAKLPSRYQTYKRDCDSGRGSECTRKQPCTPCELERLLEFPGATYCAMCSVLNTGDCHFKPGVGPYCWKNSHSRRIEPCRRCCTESLPVFHNNTSSGNLICEMPLN